MIGIVQRAGELAFARALRRALRFGDAVLDRHRLGERPPHRLILEQTIGDEAMSVAVYGRLEGREIMSRSCSFGGAQSGKEWGGGGACQKESILGSSGTLKKK